MTIEKVIEYFENFYAFEHNKKLLLKIDNVLYPIQIKEENRAVVAIYNEKLDKKYKKILKQNKYLKERIEKMKCCANCNYWFDMDSTCELTKEKISDFMVDCHCEHWRPSK